MKNKLLINLLSLTTIAFSQKNKPYDFGKISQAENDLSIYQKDSTANAVFLYEYGKTTFHDTDRRIVIRTKYYAKVKVFNKEGDKHATVKIPIYRNESAREKVSEIRAITHNGIVKTSLSKKDIFTEEVNKHWSEVKFTMPNIKENSIIEYEYILESPFKFNFKGWEFQTDIPKLFSEFYALVPGNYVYNRSLTGYQKLTKNQSRIKKRCFSVTGIPGEADCEELTYAMEDIPAFIEEDYMTSRKNHISSIKFELSEFHGFRGEKYRYTKDWKSVDKEFKTEKSIGRQLRKIDYIKKQLPEKFLAGENNLAKAKIIYNYIKDRFAWNNKFRVFKEVNVKKAFSDKVGNSTEINISLINALNAVGFDAEIVLLSTRKNGLPIKVHPVMTDFNYAIAKLNIDGNNYLLDATNKLIPFGMLPYRTLNGYGRAMNFKKGSYWIDIKPKRNNLTRTSLSLKMNENGDFEGKMLKSTNGYKAIDKRMEISSLSKEEYLNRAEEKYDNQDRLLINEYENFELDNLDKPLKEVFDITIESGLDGEFIIFNPFVTGKISENPFKLKERLYPVDFGYPRSSQFNLQLTIPDQYRVKSMPDNVALKLPNNGGRYIFSAEEKNNQISLIFKSTIKRSFFAAEEYPYLKEFYNQIIKTQNSLITLEKISSFER